MFGCGGGGDEESQTSTTAPVEQPVVNNDTSVNTIELISDPDFDLTTETELQISLPISPSETTSYFINVCSDFSENNNTVTINYASCKLRTSLTFQEQQFILSLSNTEVKLVAQIWPLVNNATAITIYWDINQSGNEWNIVF